MAVDPVYVFAPVKESSPAPVFVKAPAPLITPENARDWPASTSKTPPLLPKTNASDASPDEDTAKESVPLSRLNDEPEPSASVLAIRSVPSVTEVCPEYVLDPLNVRTPLPVFVNEPVPETTPENSVLLLSPPTDNVNDPSLIAPLPPIDPTVSSAPIS